MTTPDPIPHKTMNLTENAIDILNKRYLLKDSSGAIIETPEQRMRCVANIAKDPDLANKIYNHLINLDFLPNSPCLMNAGKSNNLGYSACFVLPVEDSLVSIFDAIKNMALVQQAGGGTGFTFEHLRPKNDPVKSTQGVASGPLSFIEVFNSATNIIKQGGTRRGANMGILSISHPDIESFITAKNKGDAFSNFNFSVSVTNDFMNAVINDIDWNLTFNSKIYKTLKARSLFNLIVENAYDHADPGLIFIDTMNRGKPEKVEACNPCGEMPLRPYESCNLCSINLKNMICYVDEKPTIDHTKISDLVSSIVPFMNDMIIQNHYPIPEIREATLKTRKIGIGIMGFSDMLAILGIPYESIDARHIIEDIMENITTTAKEVSNGRNQEVSCIAPTGTISIIAGCSSGIEPIFGVAFRRDLKDSMGKVYHDVNPIFLDYAMKHHFYSDTLIDEIIKNNGSIQSLPNIPEKVKSLFKTGTEIPYKYHILMQSAAQAFTDASISKTINMSSFSSKEDVYEAFMLALKSGCKGITIYRDGSKNNQIIKTSSEITTPQSPSSLLTTPISPPIPPTPRSRLKYHVGIIGKLQTNCGTLYNGVTVDQYGLLEDFVINNKRGCKSSRESQGRSTSTQLQYNIPAEKIIHEFKQVEPCNHNEEKTCAHAIAAMLSDIYNTDIEKQMISLQKIVDKTFNTLPIPSIEIQSPPTSSQEKTVCPSCGSTNIEPTRCATCRSCGASRC